tara:strand:- start:288 stop:749 length:462 start_codon:yes stop_codon:yes gene_type:complete
MPLHGLDNVKKMIAKNKREANANIKGVYLAGLQNIIAATPADKGTHRNNWFLTVGSPFSLYGRDGDKAASQSYISLETMPKYVLNKKLYFTNNGPGIIPLEYGGFPNPVEKGSYIKKSKSYEKLSTGGWSNQVDPGGWVRRTLILMQNKIRSL